MTTPVVRGWCPGAYRPMASGDGLVVRVRPPLGELTPDQALALADLAETFGNGRIDLTNRANLQLRGVSDGGLPTLLERLLALRLLDDDPTTEARRNIVVDPFRGLAPDDRETLVAVKLAEVLSDDALAGLPSKFGFVVDAGPLRHSAQVSGDIRIETSDATLIVRADGCDRGLPTGSAEEAAARARDLARWFLASGGVGADGRGRMARHLAAGARLPRDLTGNALPNLVSPRARPGATRAGASTGTPTAGVCLAVPFGALWPGTLRALAQSRAAVIRLTPWRMVFLPGLRDAEGLEASGLITRPDDPLLRVEACTGAPGCPQARVQTRDLACRLAQGLAEGETLHVSGCAKGCAHPRPADWTLVGRPDGGFDLVRAGTAWDEPLRRGLNPAVLQDFLGG